MKYFLFFLCLFAFSYSPFAAENEQQTARVSVLVKEGETVKIGHKIAQTGVSVVAYLPHVHYELKSANTVDADASPAYFRNFVRLLGSREFSIKIAPVDSGDILESR